jgi:Na+-transporting NADH:ubiquinone oxidoreductase subunit NqrE
MTNSSERLVTGLSVSALVLIVAAVTLPSFFVGNEKGLAAGATAAVAFLAFFGMASVLAVVVCILTLVKRRTLRLWAKLCGFAPLAITVVLVIFGAMMMVKNYAKARAEQNGPLPPPLPTTEPQSP